MLCSGKGCRVISLLMVIMLLLGMAACDDKEGEIHDDPGGVVENNVQKCYLFETDVLAENGFDDISNRNVFVRNDYVILRYKYESEMLTYMMEINGEPKLITSSSGTAERHDKIDLGTGDTNETLIMWYRSRDLNIDLEKVDLIRRKKIDLMNDGKIAALATISSEYREEKVENDQGVKGTRYYPVGTKVDYAVSVWDGESAVWGVKIKEDDVGLDFSEVPEMISDDDGRVYLYFKNQNTVLMVERDKDVRVVDIPEGKAGYKEQLLIRNGKVVFCRTNSGANGVTHTVYTLDCEAGSFDEGVELTADKGSTQFLFPDGYAIGYRNAEGVFGVTDSGETVKIFGWLDVGLTGAMVEDIWSIGKDEFFLIYNDSVDKKTHSGIVKRADEAEYLEFKASRANSETSAGAGVKTIRVVAETMTNSNSFAFEYVQRFNRKNMDYKVEIESIAGGAGEAASNLMKKMLSGDIPDVVMFGKSLRSGDLKGQNMFVDLYPYIDADKEHGRDSFVPCVLEPFEESDGTLQLLTTEFTLKTLIGSTDTLGKLRDWTFDEMLDFAEGLDDVALAYLGIPSSWTAAKGFLNNMSYALLNEFIDFDGKVCDFTDGRFARLLEICKNSTYSTATTKTPDLRGIYNGEIALTFANLDGPAEYMYATGCTYFGREPVLIGYPHGDGDSGTIILPKTQFAISKNCADKDAAWKLISFFVDSQTEVWEGVRETPESFKDQDAFPCGKKASETMLDVSKDMYAMLTVIEGKSQLDGQPTRGESKYAGAKMVEKTTINEDGEEVIEMVEIDYASPEKRANLVARTSNGEDGMAFYTTFDDDDAEILRKLFNECKTIYGTNAAAVNIILEEGEAYFTGGKSLDAVVKMVQDRVTTQINE